MAAMITLVLIGIAVVMTSFILVKIITHPVWQGDYGRDEGCAVIVGHVCVIVATWVVIWAVWRGMAWGAP